jgi:preprotein translocase subunit YajC
MFFEQQAWAGSQPPPGPDGERPDQLPIIWLIIPIFVIFWLLIINPQKKQQQKHQQRIGSLKKGDRIMTTGGIYGTVVKVEETALVLSVGEVGGTPAQKKKTGGDTSVNIRIAKSAVGNIVEEKTAEGGKEE